MKNLKIIIYSSFIVLLFLFTLNSIGEFDSKRIKIEELYIKKPWLYRNTFDFNINDESDLNIVFSFLSVFNKKSAHYIIQKKPNKELFTNNLKYNFKIKEFNIEDCYLGNINLRKDYKQRIIYKYPYIYRFIEINKRREDYIINNVCKDSKIKYVGKTKTEESKNRGQVMPITQENKG